MAFSRKIGLGIGTGIVAGLAVVLIPGTGAGSPTGVIAMFAIGGALIGWLLDR